MKLLLDANLSRRLVPALQHDFPGSSQVALMGLERASDADLWQVARDQGFVLVTKDDDFTDLQALRGYPPKLVILRLGWATARTSRSRTLCWAPQDESGTRWQRPL